MHVLFPLAFIAGIYGFVFFAPYLVTVVAMGHVIRARRQNARVVRVVVPVTFQVGAGEALQIA